MSSASLYEHGFLIVDVKLSLNISGILHVPVIDLSQNLLDWNFNCIHEKPIEHFLRRWFI